MDTERKGDFIQTSSGRLFWPLDPRADEVFMEDIAHALSNMCRFCGHCSSFYSVAEHSVRVSLLVEKWLRKKRRILGDIRAAAIAALLHDAAEAYTVDLPRPVKINVVGYADIENDVHAQISKRFGLDARFDDIIKQADDVLLATEARDLMPPAPGTEWRPLQTPLDEKIMPWSPEDAKERFINRYYYLLREGIG